MDRPVEQRKNGYEDSDFRDIINEIEGFKAEQAEIRASAAGKCSALAKRIKNSKATAKALGIPLAIVNASLKARDLERQLQDVADSIPDDLAEVWVDASGQFSMFAPADGEDASENSAATAAAKRRADAARAHHEAEQAEGAAVLDDLAGEAGPRREDDPRP